MDTLREYCGNANLRERHVEESCNLAEQEDDPMSYSPEGEQPSTPKQTFSDKGSIGEQEPVGGDQEITTPSLLSAKRDLN